MRTLIAFLLLIMSLSIYALDTSDAQCISGNCNNGFGTARWFDGYEFTGNWRNGNSVAGHYDVRGPCKKEKTFSVTIGSDGYISEGTFVRCSGFLLDGGGPSEFTGTFVTRYNPFTHKNFNTYKTGVYTDARGIIWKGNFDYIPIRKIVDTGWYAYGKVSMPLGRFIFVGDKIDPELNETTHGLYITEPVEPAVSMWLTRARPDYLDKLNATFNADAAQEMAKTNASHADGFQWGKFAALAAGAAISGIDKMSSDMQVKMATGIIQDSMAGHDGMGNTQAAINDAKASMGNGGNSGKSAGDPSNAADRKAKAKACANEYDGPNDDPQTDTYCKLAAYDACLHRAGITEGDQSGRASCHTLNELLEATGSKYTCRYCPYPF